MEMECVAVVEFAKSYQKFMENSQRPRHFEGMMREKSI